MNANERKCRKDVDKETLSSRVISCAFKVSNELGTGFLEQVYANALAIEMATAGLMFKQEHTLTVFYKDRPIGKYVADFVVDEKLIIEIKALRALTTDHEAQVLNYLAASGVQAGLLLNFGTPKVGIKRLVLNHDDTNQI